MTARFGIRWQDGRVTRIGESRSYAEQLLREASGPFSAFLPPPCVVELDDTPQQNGAPPMTMAPTPEQFLAQPSIDEDDVEPDEFPAVHVDTGDPLESIADSLRRLLGIVERRDTEDSAESQLQAQYDELDRAYAVLEEQKEEAWALIDQVLRICKPSTSKLANSIRAVLAPADVADAPAAPPAEEPDPDPDTAGLIQPHPEAPVEEWRAYARSRGYAGPDVDTANRSQIRTMLGIPHGEGVQA